MNIVVPMAGRGSRFTNQGVSVPKPLITINSLPMFVWALKSIENITYSRIIFVALKEHEAEYSISSHIKNWYKEKVEVILLDRVTEGQLSTVLTTRDIINTPEDVLIASCDTYVVSEIGHDIIIRNDNCHGIISVADLPGDRWSFARTDENNRVVEVAEKVRISNYASTGIYYFSSGKELVSTGDRMIKNGEKTRGEYYIIPVYQKYIERGWQVDISVAQKMLDMGTPDALKWFRQHITSFE